MTEASSIVTAISERVRWNNGKIIGAKAATLPKHVWSIRRSSTGRRGSNRNLTARQYGRLLGDRFAGVGLGPHLFGTHSLRRTKTTLIYRRAGNLRAVQLPLADTRIDTSA
jgi:integrase